MALTQTFNQDTLGNIGLAAAVSTAAPAYTTGNTSALSLTLTGLLRVDGSGVTQPISASTLPLPTGASTSALQTTGNTSLASLVAQLPSTLGQKTSANSLAVVIASDNVVAISATALPLPAGAATSALQTAGNTTLSAISGQLPLSLGSKLSSASLSVVLASDEIVPISIAPSTAGALSTVAGSATTGVILASNVNRKGFMVFNDGSAILYIAFSATASLTAFSQKLFPNASYISDFGYTGVISGISSSATGNTRVTEFT